MEQVCEHIRQITSIKEPKDYVCEECIKTGDSWLHLRTCQTCGVTLCCDSSPNKHMSKHSRQKKHPVAISAEPGERWMWCYEDEIIADY